MMIDIESPELHQAPDDDLLLAAQKERDRERTRINPTIPSLPVELAWTQRAAATLRAYLVAQNLSDYRILYCRDLDLHDLEQQLPDLDAAAKWEPAPSAVVGGEPIALVTHTYSVESATLRDCGFLRLPGFDLVLGRWTWIAAGSDESVRTLLLVAARDAETCARFREKISRNRRKKSESVWQIVSGYSWNDKPRVSRDADAGDALVLQPALLERIAADVLRFFNDDVAKLYETLAVPYRRGVLMYGPPGNGKTSIIRWIGGKLPQIPAMILRPEANFDADDLAEVIRRWKRLAPAILVIEDLDWVLSHVNVSSFLNTIDGIESSITGGLLLIATTNHPEKLDPAINNRPGRFDVSIEVPSPDRALRIEFLRRNLGDAGSETIDRIADMCEDCSFAHLHEVLRLSGLYAIHSGRTQRTDEDIVRAATEVTDAREAAARGFPPKPEVPFGLQHLRTLKQRR